MGANANPSFIWDGLRAASSILDFVGITFLTEIFKVFFLVANAEIINGEVVKVFYSRIQLILGILMIFKLSMTVLQVIINPDMVKDQKQGTGKVVMRVVVALFMLTLIIPFNIPGASDEASEKSLNYYINNHGVLFGFLYKIQYSVLDENVLAKLILGTTSNSTTDLNENHLSDVAYSMASTVLRVYMRINVKNQDEAPCDSSGNCDNTVCPDQVSESHYAVENVDPTVLLEHLNDECGYFSGERYAFTYVPVIGGCIQIVMALIILGFTIDVAVRAIKLAVLRLVAPIPIISYIDPQSEKDGAFGNWVKSLLSTYADLFVRLAIIYFGLFIIQAIINGGLDIFGSGTTFSLTVGFAYIFIFLGILVFMRQAPQFIKDILGLKGKPMGNVGLAGVLGGAAMALGGGGLSGMALGALQGGSAAAEAAAQGKPSGLGQAWAQNRDQMRKIVTGDKDARGGIFGRTMDRALYNTRERQLARKGLTSDNAEIAKNAFYAQEAAVHNAQVSRDLSFERLKNLGVTSDPGAMMSQEEFYNSTPNISSADFDQKYNDYKNSYQEKASAWSDFVNKDRQLSEEQTKLGKMEKNYKNVKEARSAMGTDPRLIDEYGTGRFDGRYRAGGHRQRFDPHSEGRPSDIDDIGSDRLGGEIGGGH